MARARITQPTSPDAELFGTRLRELREKRSFTLRTLADTADMSLTYLSDLERGLKVPSLTTLIRLAAALNYKVTDFVRPFDKQDLQELVAKLK